MEPHEAMISKLPTGIPGLDLITNGGIPEGRVTLVSGTAGGGKTVFAAQFIAAGIEEKHEGGVFVTFEESPADIRRNMKSLGWDIAAWEAAGTWAFVDASPDPAFTPLVTGPFDFGALLARVENAVRRVKARRVSLDSIDAIFTAYNDPVTVRRELFRLAAGLKAMGITAIMTAERTMEYGDIARHGVEEFVADNVMILRNVLEDEKRRRTIEVLKFRGTSHQKGEWPFTIISGSGIVVIPLSALELKQKSSDLRISSGSPDLDAMCGGGFFRDSIILVSGATGTGKTLLTTHFLNGGQEKGERAVLFAFEESREQMFRNARGWGMDYQAMEDAGALKVVCQYPEVMGLEDHLIRIKRIVEEFKPNRLAVDSLSALERVSTLKAYREFVIGLTSFIKEQEIAGLFTSTTPTLMGGPSITEGHISTITDLIILLRYVEVFGEMRRGLTVLKMRGSMHEKEIREVAIDDRGMHIGKKFRDVSGILSGNPMVVPSEESDRMRGLFKE